MWKEYRRASRLLISSSTPVFSGQTEESSKKRFECFLFVILPPVVGGRNCCDSDCGSEGQIYSICLIHKLILDIKSVCRTALQLKCNGTPWTCQDMPGPKYGEELWCILVNLSTQRRLEMECHYLLSFTEAWGAVALLSSFLITIWTLFIYFFQSENNFEWFYISGKEMLWCRHWPASVLLE